MHLMMYLPPFEIGMDSALLKRPPASNPGHVVTSDGRGKHVSH